MSQPLYIVLIIAAYIGLLLLISWLSSRKADNSTFFIGNRKMAWPLVVLAMITAPISGVTFISVPGMVVSKGYGYLQMCLGFIVGYFVIALVLIPLYYRYNIISIYGYLEQRFGKTTYKTGAWFFLVSKILGTSVKFLVVCIVLQSLVFEPLDIPFVLNVLLTMLLISLYTSRGGVKTVIWADMTKSLCLIVSIALCIFFVGSQINPDMGVLIDKVWNHHSSQIFFFDDPADSSYFWKQFIAGIFLVVAMTGLDQDMMQHSLSCKNSKSSKKNLYISSFLQFAVISLFLFLGSLFVLFMEMHSIPAPEKTDSIFAMVAFHEAMPSVVGILFILGIVSASFSSVGSAVTSLTTSCSMDILEAHKKYDEKKTARLRILVHSAISLLIAFLILMFYYLDNREAISAVFLLASYTYGPILGLFAFGIFTKREINPQLAAVICLLAPLLCFVIQWAGSEFFGYETGYELLIINASIVMAGLALLPYKSSQTVLNNELLSENY